MGLAILLYGFLVVLIVVVVVIAGTTLSSSDDTTSNSLDETPGGTSSSYAVEEFDSSETAPGILDDNTLAPDQDEDIHPFEEDFDETAPFQEDDSTDIGADF